MKHLTTILIVIVAAAVLISGCSSSQPPKMGKLGSAHTHADFRVYLDGEQVDFSQDRYQVRSKFVHVEDNNGDVIHVHATNVQFGFFLSTLGMTLGSSCFTLDDGRKFCNNDEMQLRMYVNGKQNSEFGSYIFKNCDKILVSFGNEEELPDQLATITSRSCK